MPKLRVVTLNTWKGDGAYGARLKEMARGLAALQPDLVALQECLVASDLGLDTARDLAEALGAQAVLHPGRRKERMVEGRRAWSTSGLAVLSRLPVLGVSARALPADPADGDRDALAVEVETACGKLHLVCLHLTHLAGRDNLRREQLAAVLAGLSGPALVAGDFNATLDVLKPPAPLADCRVAVGAPHRTTLVDDDRAVDHVLMVHPSPWRVRLVQRVLDIPGIDGVLPSDHYGLMVELES